MKCPVCGCSHFYVKNPEDEFETYEFECKPDGVEFAPESQGPESQGMDTPELTGATRIFCEKCAWNGEFDGIKN